MTTSPTHHRHAVIDVGTNSVKLLVGDVGRTVKLVLKRSRQTRLGQGAFRTKRLQPEAIVRTVAAVGEFAAEAAELQPETLGVLATSATREAANGDELVQAIFRTAGLHVEIITGDQEAAFVFRGVTSDPTFAEQPMLIVDVGGGSTEWIVGEGFSTYLRKSTRLGTTRLLEMNPVSDPPTPADLAICRTAVADVLHWEVRPRLQPVLRSFCGREVRLVGLGGALKTLARIGLAPASPVPGEPLRFSREQLCVQVDRLWRLSSQERRGLSELDPDKADVILAGVLIYEAVMNEFNFAELFVSRRGLRDGALIDAEASSAQFAATAVRASPGTQPERVDAGASEPSGFLGVTFSRFVRDRGHRHPGHLK